MRNTTLPLFVYVYVCIYVRGGVKGKSLFRTFLVTDRFYGLPHSPRGKISPLSDPNYCRLCVFHDTKGVSPNKRMFFSILDFFYIPSILGVLVKTSSNHEQNIYDSGVCVSSFFSFSQYLFFYFWLSFLPSLFC